jgi:hypothetical protein
MLKELNLIILSGFLFFIIACQSSANSKNKVGNINHGAGIDSAGENTFAGSNKLKVNLVTGTSYHYTITNESETELDANGKTLNNRHRSDFAITYNIQKDSAGNYLLRLHYDKIHLYSKTGDNETELDAANASATMNPIEKMLGVLKAPIYRLRSALQAAW